MSDTETAELDLVANSLTFSCGPTLPDDDIVDSILDARNSRSEIRRIWTSTVSSTTAETTRPHWVSS